VGAGRFQQLGDRNAECGRELAKRADARASVAILELAEEPGAHPGTSRQAAKAQAEQFPVLANATSELDVF
jgi:hypothetical protein